MTDYDDDDKENDNTLHQYLRAETERAQREVDILTKCLTCPQVVMMMIMMMMMMMVMMMVMMM